MRAFQTLSHPSWMIVRSTRTAIQGSSEEEKEEEEEEKEEEEEEEPVCRYIRPLN